MKVQVEALSPVEKKLSIEVEAAQVTQELDRAYSALGRQVKLPGFRQGKVPRRILEQRFREQVEDDVIQRVVQNAYLEAIREHRVEPVSQPQVTNSGLKANAPFAFEARVEVRPRVEVKDWQGLPLPGAAVKVEDKEVEEQLETMRQRMSRLEPVEGRDVAQAGDLVSVDYEAHIDGAPFPGSKAEGVTLEVAPGELVESKVAALEGAKVGDAKELDYVFPTDYRVESVRGKTAHFRLHLKGLQRRVTPALDDTFAQSVGAGVSTLEELRARVRGDLEGAQKSKRASDQRDALMKGLIERNPFEVPRTMVERALDSMMEGAFRSMARAGVDPRQLNVDFMRIREDMRERAVQEVKGTLLFEALAQKENIQVSEEELDARIAKLAEEIGQPADVVRQHLRSHPDEQEGLSLRLREEKTIEFLKAHAKYSEDSPPAPAQP